MSEPKPALRRPWPAALMIAVCTFVATGCGGGSGGGGGSGATSTQQKAYQADLDTVASVGTYLATQGTLGQSQLAAAALAYLKGNPAFVNPAMTSDGTVYGTLQDGVPFSIATNDPTLNLQLPVSTAAKRSASPSSSGRVKTMTAAGGALPGGSEAFVINGFPTYCNSPAATIASELTAAGYHVTSSSGLLNDWKAVSNAAILFNSSHGVVIPDKTGTPVFWQQSGQIPSRVDIAWAGPLMKSGAIMIDEIFSPGESVLDGEQVKMNWGQRYDFSSKFLTNSSMFTKNSLFWDESCSGTSSAGRTFIANLQQGNGLDLFAGWSQPVVIMDGNETSSFFFDRALGLNKFAPIDPSNPPPNDWSSINGIMQTTNRNAKPSELLSQSDPEIRTGATTGPVAILAFVNGSGTVATLIPSIASDSIDSTTKVLTLTGSFGSDQGKVTLGSSDLTVKSWTATQITTDAPTTAGNLQVISPYGTLSNVLGFNTTATAVLKFSLSGDWGTAIGTADGNYSYGGALGVREQLTDVNNNPIDRIFVPYDLVPDQQNPTEQDIDAQVLLWLPVGQALTAGEVFKYSYSGTTTNTFLVGIPNPGSPGSPLDAAFAYTGATGETPAGTLTVTTVSQLPDGTNVFTFTFSFASSTGGGFNGSGTATWKHK